MSEQRRVAVEKAFERFAKGSGKIKLSDIPKIVFFENHPDCISGKKTKEELLAEFMKSFDNIKDKDGMVTKEEFLERFADLSMLIFDDNDFLAMLDGTRVVREKEEAKAEGEDEEPTMKERVDYLVNEMRRKLLNQTKTQDEYMLRNLLNEFDNDKSGGISVEELVWLLYKLGIAVDRKYVVELFKRFDLNKSGSIDYEEFCAFLIANPYTR